MASKLEVASLKKVVLTNMATFIANDNDRMRKKATSITFFNREFTVVFDFTYKINLSLVAILFP